MAATSTDTDDAAEPRQPTYTITELAEEFGVTARAIRFYEDKGLLSPARSGMARVYSRRDRARLKLILRGRRLRFALDDIHAFLDLYDLHGGETEQLRVLLRRGRERLAEMRAQRRDLDEAIAELEESCGQAARMLRERGLGQEAA